MIAFFSPVKSKENRYGAAITHLIERNTGAHSLKNVNAVAAKNFVNTVEMKKKVS